MTCAWMPGDRIGDSYLVLEPMARGGMAEVYLAADLTTDRAVALKTLPAALASRQDLKLRLAQEAEITRRLDHPNVVKLLDDGVQRGTPYVVFELLSGETLAELLARRGPLAAEIAVPLARQAALALDAVHRQGVVHRDVKPDNLFLCGPPGAARHLKLLDFGLATAPETSPASQPFIIHGTLTYMAPEQAVAEPVDGRADIYSLGVVLFRMLTGELPFADVPAVQLLTHQLRSPAPPPSWLIEGLDPRLDRIVTSALRKNPANRYATMADLITDLQKLGTGEEVDGAPLVHEPDCYRPWTDDGRQAMTLLASRRERRPTTTVVAA